MDVAGSLNGIEDAGLFRRSPGAASGEHWLAPDNLLALRVLQVASADELAAKLTAGIERHGAPVQSLVEVLDRQVVAWPPQAAVQRELVPGIWQETYEAAAVLGDWPAQSDLALLGALNAWNQGDRVEAERRYATALAAFDGSGFKDASFDGQYATHTLSLALFAGRKLGMPFDKRMLDALSARQQDDGGFAAHYTPSGETDGADTATTAYTLLALYSLR